MLCHSNTMCRSWTTLLIVSLLMVISNRVLHHALMHERGEDCSQLLFVHLYLSPHLKVSSIRIRIKLNKQFEMQVQGNNPVLASKLHRVLAGGVVSSKLAASGDVGESQSAARGKGVERLTVKSTRMDDTSLSSIPAMCSEIPI
ncbi:hypothetical protein B296_00000315 [Ensete ventricosum]|uniref:Uncharacterized protein n=1 Tax=Ensete ventricosum TaxID=4639 RepID=A0A426YQI9_ENSVE|nr:hypothetical protein B296_00000315 [Ensete ventricosum]